MLGNISSLHIQIQVYVYILEFVYEEKLHWNYSNYVFVKSFIDSIRTLVNNCAIRINIFAYWFDIFANRFHNLANKINKR